MANIDARCGFAPSCCDIGCLIFLQSEDSLLQLQAFLDFHLFPLHRDYRIDRKDLLQSLNFKIIDVTMLPPGIAKEILAVVAVRVASNVEKHSLLIVTGNYR